jgi:hypothetical protein
MGSGGGAADGSVHQDTISCTTDAGCADATGNENPAGHRVGEVVEVSVDRWLGDGRLRDGGQGSGVDVVDRGV